MILVVTLDAYGLAQVELVAANEHEREHAHRVYEAVRDEIGRLGEAVRAAAHEVLLNGRGASNTLRKETV
jgi:hypothetical protein